MKIVAINKLSEKWKIWSVEMPNAPYSTRYIELGSKIILHKVPSLSNIHFQDDKYLPDDQ